MNCVLLIPLYNHAVAVQALLPQVDDELRRIGATAQLVLVDDGSTESTVPDVGAAALAAITDPSPSCASAVTSGTSAPLPSACATSTRTAHPTSSSSWTALRDLRNN